MTDDTFGRGIYVVTQGDNTEYEWDLDVNESGDLRTVSNTEEELLKDVAFRSAINLTEPEFDDEGNIESDGVLGRVLTPTTMNRIRATVKRTLDAEPRIDRILSLDVSERESNVNSVQIQAQVVADQEMVDLVFEVSE